MTHPDTRSHPRRGRRLLRGLRIAVVSALVTLIALIALLALALGLESVRGRALDRIGHHLVADVPGDLEFHLEWPAFGHVRARDVRWTAEGDTLVLLDALELEVDLASIPDRRVHVRSLGIDTGRVNVDAIAHHLPTGDDASGGENPVAAVLRTVDAGAEETLGFSRADTVAIENVHVAVKAIEAVVDDLTLAVDLRQESTQPWFALDLHVRGLDGPHLTWRLRALRGPDLEIELTPLLVRSSRTLADEVPPPFGTRLRVERAALEAVARGGRAAVDFDGVWLDGDAGRVVAGGRWSDSGLRTEFEVVRPASFETLGRAVEAVGGTLPSLEGIPTELDVVSGRFVADVVEGQASIDTFAVAAPGLRVGGHGRVGPDDASLTLGLDVEPRALPPDWSVRLPFEPEEPIRGRVVLDGPWRRPALAVALESAPFGVDTRFVADLERSDRTEVDVQSLTVVREPERVDAVESFTVTFVHGDRLAVSGLHLESTIGDLRADADLSTDAIAVDATTALHLPWARITTLVPELGTLRGAPDSLHVDAATKLRGPLAALDVDARVDLTVDRRSRVTVVGEARALDVREDPGSALASVDSTAVEVEVVDLDLRTLSAALSGSVPPAVSVDGTLAGRLSARRAGKRETLDVDLRARRAAWTGGREDLEVGDLRVGVAGERSGGGTIRVDRIDLASDPITIRGRGTVSPERVDLTAHAELGIDGERLGAWARAGGANGEVPIDGIEATVDLRGTGPADHPAIDLDLRARASTRTPGGVLDLSARATHPSKASLENTGGFDGWSTALEIGRADTTLLRADLLVPSAPDRSPWDLGDAGRRPWSLDVDTGELELEQLTSIAGLDRYGRFTGTLRSRLGARADEAGAVALEGSLRAGPVEADLLDGTSLRARTELALGGTPRAPVLEGTTTIDGGLIRLPEARPELVDTERTPLLWAERATPRETNGTTARPDLTASPPADAASGASPPPADLDLDVTIDVPGSIRLVGQGLDVELGGTLEVSERNDRLAVVGDLEARRGTYDFLGRRFSIRTGKVSFRGDTNPTVELRLAASLESGTYFVEIGGAIDEPEFELSSDPPLSEGDIVSVLVLGRTLDELETGQNDVLQRRTTEIAARLGANRLADRVGRQLGVDVLSIESASEGTGQALVVGKYVNPRLLVRYEQALDENVPSLVSVEYELSEFLRLETTKSYGSRSGAELRWSRDY